MRAALLTIILVLAVPGVARAAAIIDVVKAAGGPPVRIAAEGASNAFFSPTWTPDGTAVVTIGRDAVVAHPAGGGPARRVRHLGDALEAVLAHGGGAVAEVSDRGFASRRGGIAIRDLRTGAVTARLAQWSQGDDLYESPPAVCWSRDGSRVAVIARERRSATLRVVDARSGALLLRRRAVGGFESDAECFSPDGARLVVSGVPTRARTHSLAAVIDVTTGALRRLPAWGRDAVESAAWSPAGDRIALATSYGLSLVDPTTGWGPAVPATDGAPFQGGDGVRTLRWAPDGRSIAYVGTRFDDADPGAAVLFVLPAEPPAPPRRLKRDASFSGIDGLAWSPDGTKLAATSWADDAPVGRRGARVAP